MRHSFLVAAALSVALAGCRTAPASRPAVAGAAADSAGAHRAAVAFLAAFDSLQWEPFAGFLADDVTMFFPFGDTPRRADGRAAVEARFRPFFERGREVFARSGRSAQGLAPRDLVVQPLGDAAVVSFHLGGERPARRSLVLRRGADGRWQVVHWHASPSPPVPNVPRPDSAAARPPG